jgi:hypothetical protein
MIDRMKTEFAFSEKALVIGGAFRWVSFEGYVHMVWRHLRMVFSFGSLLAAENCAYRAQ